MCRVALQEADSLPTHVVIRPGTHTPKLSALLLKTMAAQLRSTQKGAGPRALDLVREPRACDLDIAMPNLGDTSGLEHGQRTPGRPMLTTSYYRPRQDDACQTTVPRNGCARTGNVHVIQQCRRHSIIGTSISTAYYGSTNSRHIVHRLRSSRRSIRYPACSTARQATLVHSSSAQPCCSYSHTVYGSVDSLTRRSVRTTAPSTN